MEALDFPKHLKVITRATWEAKAPQEGEEDDDILAPLKMPLSWIHYNDTHTSMCDNLEQCKRILQDLQLTQMSAGWPDITYKAGITGVAWKKLAEKIKDIMHITSIIWMYPVFAIFHFLYCKLRFMIATSGEVYVGRGWNHKPHAIQLEILDDAIDIAFIGNFERSAPHPKMLKAAEELIYHGVITRKINMSYSIRWFREYMDPSF